MPKIRLPRVSLCVLVLLATTLGALLSCSKAEVGGCLQACGEGLVCSDAADGFACRPSDPDSISIRITHPESERWYSEAPIEADCEVRVPQLEQVLLIATPPPPNRPVVIPARDLGGGRWTAKYTASMGAATEGTHTLRCEAHFGPSVYENVVRSDEMRVHVDLTPPVIELALSKTWFRSDEEVEIAVRIHDGDDDERVNSGVDLKSVVLMVDREIELLLNDVAARNSGNDIDDGSKAGPESSSEEGSSEEKPTATFEYTLSLDSLIPADFHGSIPLEVRASDLAGNTSVAAHELLVDFKPPTISFNADAAGRWRLRSSSPFTIPLHVERNEGSAPLAYAPQAFDTDGALLSTAEPTEEGWALSFLPKELAEPGDEVELEWTVRVANAAGFEAATEGIIRIDDRAPQVTVPESLPWVRRGEPVLIDVVAVDSGSGFDPDSWTHSPGMTRLDCEPMGEDEFRCAVPTDAAPDGVEAPFVSSLHFGDRAGNAGAVDFVVPVDALGPELSTSWDEATWFPAASAVPIDVVAFDAATGVERVYVVANAGNVDCVPGENLVWQCPVDTSHVTGTVEDHSVTIHAVDQVGNVAEWISRIPVDATPPTVSFEDPSPWFGSDEPIVLAVRAEDEGSGVVAVSVLIEGETVGCTRGTNEAGESSDDWMCVLEAGAFLGERIIPYSVRAVDAMGLSSEAGGSLRLDTEAPTILPDEEEWVPRATDVAMTFQVVDGGSGIAPGSVHVPHPSGSRPCVPSAGDTYTCVVDTTTALAGKTSQFPVTVHATDVAGNVAVEVMTISVDDEGPEIVLGGTPEWFGYGAHNILVNVNDSGSGIDSLRESTRLVPVGPEATDDAPITPVVIGNALRFQVNGARFLPAQRTIPDFPMEFTAVDRLGNETVRRVYFSFDGQPPTIEVDAFSYPPGSGSRFKRNAGEIGIVATVGDEGRNGAGQRVNGSGAVAGTLVMTFTHHDRTSRTVYPTHLGGNQFLWTLDVAEPLLEALDGESILRFKAWDLAGNEVALERPLRLTRRLWETEVHPGAVTSWGGALAGDRLVIPATKDGDSKLVALHARTGVEIWRASIHAELVFPPNVTVGRRHAYYLEKNGYLNSRLLAFLLHPPGNQPILDWHVALTGLPGRQIGVTDWLWRIGGAYVETVLAPTGDGFFAVYREPGTSPNGAPIDPGHVQTFTVDHERLWVSDGHDARIMDFDPRQQVIDNETVIASPGSTFTFAHDGTNVWANLNQRLVGWTRNASILHDEVLPEGFEGVAIAPVLVGENSDVWWVSPWSYLRRFLPPTFQVVPNFPVPVSPNGSHRNSPVLGVDGTAYTIVHGHLQATRRDGTIAWMADLGIGFNSDDDSPLLACDGTLYIGTNDGRVLALASDSAGLSRGWPRRFRDNRNTNSIAWPIRQSGHCVD